MFHNPVECKEFSGLPYDYDVECEKGSRWHPGQLAGPNCNKLIMLHGEHVPVLRLLVYLNYHHRWGLTTTFIEDTVLAVLERPETHDIIHNFIEVEDMMYRLFLTAVRVLIMRVPRMSDSMEIQAFHAILLKMGSDVVTRVFDPFNLLRGLPLTVRSQEDMLGPYRARVEIIHHCLDARIPESSPSDEILSGPAAALAVQTITERRKEMVKKQGDAVFEDAKLFVASIEEEREKSPKVKWCNLPGIDPDFTGRLAEVETLSMMLRRGNTVVAGMGGVGKTTLALAVANHVKPVFLGNVRVIKASSFELVARQFGEFAKELGVPLQPHCTIAVLFMSVFDYLGYMERCLLVFDDVESPEMLKEVLSARYMTKGETHRVLFTSRCANYSPLIMHSVDKENVLPLKVWRMEEALAYLRRFPFTHEERGDMGCLTKFLWAHPYAMRCAMRYIHKKLEGDLPRFVERCIDTQSGQTTTEVAVHQLLQVMDEPDPADVYSHTAPFRDFGSMVRKSFDRLLRKCSMSVKDVAEREVAERALVLLYVLALAKASSFSLESVRDSCFASHRPTYIVFVLEVLVDLALICQHREDRFSMHPLVRALVRRHPSLQRGPVEGHFMVPLDIRDLAQHLVSEPLFRDAAIYALRRCAENVDNLSALNAGYEPIYPFLNQV
jgi:hypothetical protein